jgi:hypothetical protein
MIKEYPSKDSRDSGDILRRVSSIIHLILDIREFSAKWVLKGSVLLRSMIQCLLHKPFWTDFSRILWDLLNCLISMGDNWIQTPKNRPGNAEQWFPVFKEVHDTEVMKQGSWHLSSVTNMEFL